MKLKSILLFALTFFMFANVHAQSQKTNILVFSKTAGYRHKSIPAGIKLLTKMAGNNNWDISFSEDSNDFTIDNLSKFDALVFLNTTGDVLNDNQQKALQKYFAKGKGFVGIHAASDTEMEWDWYSEMVGAKFKNHPKIQPANLMINTSCNHPAIKDFNKVEIFNDEWYNFVDPVGKHVTVLASLDESSYEGKRMHTSHPISWYHHYDGGRVFYTGLGHRDETVNDKRFYKHLEGGIQWAAGLKEDHKLSKKWNNLLEGDPYKNWDVFMGVPHASVKGLDNVDPKSNGIKGEPLGLNNDPKNVFSFETIEGEQVLHISGEVYGALTSKKEYKNYHLKMQFKWGEKIWAPRIGKPRDSGVLYHCTGPYRKFWNVWMASQEMQVQEGDVGDYYGLSNVGIDIPSALVDDKKGLDYKRGATLNKFSKIEKGRPAHCDKGFDNENAHGEWNTLELICYEGTSLHIVNGKVVMALFNSRYQNSEKEFLPLEKGRIQIQSEAAEIFYKNIAIKSIKKIPNKYKKSIKK